MACPIELSEQTAQYQPNEAQTTNIFTGVQSAEEVGSFTSIEHSNFTYGPDCDNPISVDTSNLSQVLDQNQFTIDNSYAETSPSSQGIGSSLGLSSTTMIPTIPTVPYQIDLTGIKPTVFLRLLETGGMSPICSFIDSATKMLQFLDEVLSYHLPDYRLSVLEIHPHNSKLRLARHVYRSNHL